MVNPEKAFSRIDKESLEDIVGDYFKLLVFFGFIAAIVVYGYTLASSLYLDLVHGANINYINLMNYYSGRASAVFFFYLFFGSFFIFFISLFFSKFFNKMKFTHFLKMFLRSTGPILLLSWIPGLLAGSVAWSLLLLIIGGKIKNKVHKIDSKSINQRD